MSLIALLVEGNTEIILLNRLLPYIQLPDRLFVSKDLVDILNNNTHGNKIWLKDCRGDTIPTWIKKNAYAFLRNNFEKIIIIRDYFPAYRPPTNLCKKDLCTSLFHSIPESVTLKYCGNIFINLSVEEIEAWYFADKRLFERLKPTLTEAYINTNYDNILAVNPETIRHPSAKLKNIIAKEIPEHTYNKTEKEVHFIISRLDLDACIRVTSPNYVQSFNRIVNYLMDIL